VPAPAFDHDLGFSERVEDFAIEQFVAQARIEAFDIAVLSRATPAAHAGARYEIRKRPSPPFFLSCFLRPEPKPVSFGPKSGAFDLEQATMRHPPVRASL
jgi:hypothetical protein